MRKFSIFLVKKRKMILISFILFALAGIYLTLLVPINYDLTEYLPDDSNMKIGMTLMEDEFQDGDSSTLKVVIEGLDSTQQIDVEAIIQDVNEDLVISTETNADGYTLYLITVPDHAYSDLAESTYNDVQTALEEYQIYIAGTIAEANSDFLATLIFWALSLLLLILVILSHSWFEPIIFMITIGIAILINMGTNIFLPSVSEMTFSIAAVLQLVLSMDYSIMLMERYRQEKETKRPIEAMVNAITKGIQSIGSSSITTVVGLLTLVFMSFTIGLDMGLVLAKGIFISFIVTFTVLPALILAFDELIEKTRKKTIEPKMTKFAHMEFKLRYVFLSIFVVLIGVGVYFSQNIGVDFFLSSQAKDSEFIETEFPTHTQIVFLYESEDEDKVLSFIQSASEIEETESIQAYANTLGVEMTSEQLAQTLSFDQSIVEAFIYQSKGHQIGTLKLNEFVNFIVSDISSNAMFASYFDQQTLAQMQMMQTYTNTQTITASYDAATLASMLQMDQTAVENLIAGYYVSNSQVPEATISLFTFVEYLVGLSQDPNTSSQFTTEQATQLQSLYGVMGIALQDIDYTPQTLAASPLFAQMATPLDASMLYMIFLIHDASVADLSTETMSLYDFMAYLNSMIDNANFESLFDQASAEALSANYQMMREGREQLIGETYSRLILETSYKLSDEGAIDYLDELKTELDDLGMTYYVIGELPMAAEMTETFVPELNFITILTVVAIFIVVAISFKSFFVPIVLVSLIQTAIYLTTSITILEGTNLYFLSIIIVQAILMGAAIDYGILYTSYYRHERLTNDVQTSMINAYHGSILAILTSSTILIVITSVVGMVVENATTAAVVVTIAKGMGIAVVLTLFVLPPVLAVFDKFIAPKNSLKIKKEKAE